MAGLLSRPTTPKVPPPTTRPMALSSSAPPDVGTVLPEATTGVTMLTTAAHELHSLYDPATSRKRLVLLAAQLTALGRERAVAVVREFLATGTDAPTRLEFALGNDGLLTGAPTLRVFLLDLTERLDPAAAVTQARAILATPGSADEWAVAMRSLAHAAPEARDLLTAKLHELLHNQLWRQSPSTGWLEAFDVAVYLGDVRFVSDLSELMRPANGHVANHAAFLALDRLAARDPARVLSALLDSPETMQEREVARAGMMARVDVQDAAQQALLERYLLDPARSKAELDAFAGVYPNANTFISPNLLTTFPVVPSGTIARHDVVAAAVVTSWLADARFARLRPQLERIHARLIEFTRLRR